MFDALRGVVQTVSGKINVIVTLRIYPPLLIPKVAFAM